MDRRGFLAGAAGLTLAGCGRTPAEDAPGGAPPERATTSVLGDIELLQRAYSEEIASAGVYGQLAAGASGARRGIFRRFEQIERAHARRIATALRDRDTRPEPLALSLEEGDAQLTEGRAIAFYLDLLPKIYDPALRSALTSILTVEAEQLAVLRTREGLAGATDPFVYGFRS